MVNVAFVMGEGATMIDFAGPWEVFQDVGAVGGPDCFLYTVSDSLAELSTSGGSLEGKPRGMRFRADYTFENAPQPNVLIMGAQQGHTAAKVEWIRTAAKQADFVMSVCTGAFLLAKTGLLDSLEATTHHLFYDKFASQFDQVKLVRDARFVDNGKFVTAGGLTSGIDGALHLVDRIWGREVARKIAGYMEYTSRSRMIAGLE